jgi:hypothetical protein
LRDDAGAFGGDFAGEAVEVGFHFAAVGAESDFGWCGDACGLEDPAAHAAVVEDIPIAIAPEEDTAFGLIVDGDGD